MVQPLIRPAIRPAAFYIFPALAAGGALATIQLVGTARAADSGSTLTSSFTWPTEIVANDLMLLMLMTTPSSTQNPPVTPPAGFTEIGGVVTSAETAGSREVRMWLWSKFAAGTEGNTVQSLLIPGTAGTNSSAIAGIVLRNANPSGTIEVAGDAFATTDPRPTAPTVNLNAGAANRWAVLFWGQAEDSTQRQRRPPPGTVNTVTWTGGSGTSYTLRAFITTSAGSDRMGGVLTAAMATGETISGKRPPAPTGSDVYSQGWVARALVIKPAGTSGGGGAPNDIYYVDSSATGNNSANGLSPSTPWKTIAKVNGSTFQPGDTILFAGGQTFTGGISLNSASWNRTAAATDPVTIGSYGTGRATISSGTTYGFISADLGGFHLRDLIFTGASGAVHGVMIWNSEAGTGKIQYVRVTNLLIQGYDGHGFLLYGGFATSSTAGFNDVIVDGVVATGNTTGGSNVGTAGIAALGRYGFNLDPTHPTHTNVTIRNCVAHGNTGRVGAANWTGSGIVVAGVQTCLIEYCVAYNNGVNSNSPAGPCGIMAFDSDLVTIQYCEAYDNKTGNNVDGGGFDLDGGMRNSVIQYCYAHANSGAGLMLYGFTDANVSATSWTTNTIRYCISQNDAVGRTGWAAGGLVIAKFDATMANARAYNNTVYSNSTGASVCFVGPQGTGTISGTVANNIFYSSSNAYLVDAQTYNPTGVIFQKNDYYGPGGFRIRWNNVTSATLGAWNRDTTGLTSNPQLSSAGNGGTIGGYVVGQPSQYKLAIGSPMIGAGLDMNATFSINPGTKDFFDTTIPVGGTFEIGAYEGTGV